MSVLSSDGKTWLTKLDRIGKLSADNHDLVFNNLGHLIHVDMLKELYRELDGKKACGIDKMTKIDYGKCLDENINKLIIRIRRGTYKPKPARITEIPKEDGSFRPLAISCFEDKLVQLAVNKILCKIYEPIFLPCSYGFRPGKNCHDALRKLNKATFRNWDGAIIEIDIQKCFNEIPHQEMMEFLQRKISDRRLLRLIEVLMKTPIIQGENVTINTRGCPQGAIISPVISNIYLHYVIDEWFESIKKTHIERRAELIRFADDMVFAFQNAVEAKRFYEALPKRLNKYGLKMHLGKSQIIPAGHTVACRAEAENKRLSTFKFLGFTCYFGKSRSGYWRLKFTSRRDRFSGKLKSMNIFLKKNLNTKDANAILDTVGKGVRGWVNYHNISDNERRVDHFIFLSKRLIWRWFNRRGGKKRTTWTRCVEILETINFPKKGKVISMYQTC